MNIRTIIVIVLVLLIGYGAKEAWPLIKGPQLSLSITSPSPSSQNKGIPDNSLTLISGSAVHTTGVSVNGNTVLTDQKGNFQTALTLPSGGAILTVTATDRFGRTVTQRRTVFVP